MNSPSQTRSLDLLWPPLAFLVAFLAADRALAAQPQVVHDLGGLVLGNVAALAAIACSPRRVAFRGRSASVALMAAVLFGAITLVANKALDALEDPSDLAVALAGLTRVRDLLAAAIVIVFIAPVVEEGYFRGMVYPWLASRIGDAAGIVLSSAVFAALHPGGWTATVLFLIAIFWAVLTRLTGSLMPSMVGHMSVNAVSFAMLVGQGRYARTIGWTDIALTGALCLVGYWVAGFWTARRSQPESEAHALTGLTLYSVGMAVLISITIASLIMGVPDKP